MPEQGRTDIKKSAVQSMCDYSLHATASRPARAGEILISTAFQGTSTRGFAAVDEGNVAICLMPGTELGFAQDVKYDRKWLWPANTGFGVARFCKVAASFDEPHQDALEFPDGKIVLLTALVRGQRAWVLQLPPNAKAKGKPNSEGRGAISLVPTVPVETALRR